METLDRLRSGELTGSKRLDLSCELTEFPMEILSLADSLEILNLSNNRLQSLPPEIAQLRRLRVAFFNNNAFETLPHELSACPNLSMIGFKGNRIREIDEQALFPNIRWLILTNNQIERLPKTIGLLKKLQKCMLAGNRLRALPDEMANCQNLELIRISANQLSKLPSWLLTLPRLAWLAYASNPFCPSTTHGAAPAISTIDVNEITLGAILGEGASGVIYKGTWTPLSASPQPIAVKLFKGEITSDGLPADEMRACLLAGQHPNRVNVLGKLSQTFQGKEGLVFSFISPDYANLGGPPSLETCTRDTYSDDTVFTPQTILQIAKGVASSVDHLHSNGIMHGDLYAHNILINASGESILGDFGAASLYDVETRSTSQSLEQIEARAFGCLLEDLLERCTDVASPNDKTTTEQLRYLQRDCMQPMPSNRPLFASMCERLSCL